MYNLNTCSESAFFEYMAKFDGRQRIPETALEILREARKTHFFTSWAQVETLLPQVGPRKIETLKSMFVLAR